MYTVRFANGQQFEAIDFWEVMQILGACHFKGFGDRWLAWASYEDSRDDDGAKAFAEIREI